MTGSASDLEKEDRCESWQMNIGGKCLDAEDGSRFDVMNPATGEVVATVPGAKQAEVDRAVEAARAAFDDGPWPTRTSQRERARVLFRAADIIRREREQLAELEVIDCGKPLSDALEDMDEAAFQFEYYAGWTTKIMGDIPPVGPDAMSLAVKEPMGVAGLIVPWNYPFLMATQKVAPALAAGCSVILKPAEQTPLTALQLPRILEEAGLPQGVVSVVTGFGPTAGAPIVRHPKVDKISFTGSLEVGKTVMREGADTVKRVTLELGGKSPNIVFADAEFEEAIKGTCFGIFWNQGEVCSAGSRVFIERSIYDRALDAMVEQGRAVRMGSGLDSQTTMGPLITEEQKERVLSYIGIGQEEGAEVAYRGETPTEPELANGYFVPPTILHNVRNDMRVAQEEIFGPVMSVIPFEDPAEAVALANDSHYGLAASVWTRDIKKAFQISRQLRVGIVWINDSQPGPTEAPWGGYKQSGVGRELGPWGMEEYLEVKHIYVNLS
jgi:acyl-CoA reductase-like NAD-dependent aldehyde dehydrogenase